MPNVTAMFFLVFGIGLVAVALQGAARGRLPNGPKGLERGEGVSRSGQPLQFWFFFLLYGSGGAWLTVHAIRLLSGDAPPAP